MPVTLFHLGRICALLLPMLLLAACGGSKSTDGNDNHNAHSNKSSRDNPIVCQQNDTGINWPALESARCNLLSNYGLFNGLPNQASNSKGGILYQLNSELFSDYARKYRYIFLPNEASKIVYKEKKSLEFPIGTVLVKVFSLPTLSTNEPHEEIIEVRLMIHRDNGWIFIPYVWDKTNQDAYLAISGSKTTVTFNHAGKSLYFDYESPSQQRCGQCHQVTKNNKLIFLPIGTKVRHLNRTIKAGSKDINQLEYWQSLGIIDLPSSITNLPYAPDWRDDSNTLQDRAKAYLDINCAHCHNPKGAASLSGLSLEYTRTSIDYSHGLCNSSHGWRGGGFDIWPGRGIESSIPKRMKLDGATDRMPPFGRIVSDDEAIKLIIQWIDSMSYKECVSG